MLLPYYIASMNIEHEYYERTAEYKPFEGICLVDTFELAEDKQLSLMFTQENTERVERLRRTKLFVIIGNPPYNTAQVSENDNNKNRKYRIMDARVSHTYGYDSTASNKNKLADPYVKAIRWASDKVLENGEGIVAFVSNNSFVDEVTFDGVRKHLGADFDLVYVVDLKGNIRKDSMRDGVSLGEKHTVFGLSAMVGVCISFFIKKKKPTPHQIYYWDTDFRATRAEKFGYLDNAGNVYELANVVLEPDQKHNWITTGFKTEFGYFMPLGAKDSSSIAAQSIFRSFSLGLNSNRDAWVYNHNCSGLRNNMEKSIDFYNRQVYEWTRTPPATDIDGFVVNDDSVISWSSSLKNFLKRGVIVSYDGSCLREAMYRPFCKLHLYYGKHFIHRRGLWQSIFPHSESEAENRVICTTGIGSRKPFHALVTNVISDLHLLSDTQCFPFYVYDEDGKNRRQNITEWAVEQFSSTLGSSVDRWQIFYFVYGLFHAPSYREKYQANLRRELPRIPIPKSMEQFLAFASAGERLAGLHVNYESQPEYPIERLENPDRPLSWRVAKMKFTKDKTAIVYNDFLILAGIPAEAFEYHLRNRPALEWIVDQYQVRTDKRSGIVLVQRKMDRRLFFLDSRG